MNKFKRAFRHLMTTTAAGKRAFPDATLKSIQKTIAQGEQMHRAEIRMIIEPSLEILMVLKGLTSRERARELFAQYRIWDTEENGGVLIYVNLADHKVEIIADRAVGRALEKDHWDTICRTMTQGFAQARFHDSTAEGIAMLNALLEAHFPAEGARANQLSNRPVVL